MLTDPNSKYIKFGCLTGADIIQSSEVQVVNREFYNVSSRDTVKYGVLDNRLGVSNKDKVCGTCFKSLADCVGHFGYLKLQLPVFHGIFTHVLLISCLAGYFKATIQILQQICKTCSKVLINERDKRTYLKKLRQPFLENPVKLKILKGSTSH